MCEKRERKTHIILICMCRVSFLRVGGGDKHRVPFLLGGISARVLFKSGIFFKLKKLLYDSLFFPCVCALCRFPLLSPLILCGGTVGAGLFL